MSSEILHRQPTINIGMIGSVANGKCVAPNTKILMYDGDIKLAKNLKIGDKIMGDEFSSREIVTVTDGIDDMYRVTLYGNKKYITNFYANSKHILCLKDRKNRVEMQINEYVKLDKLSKNNMVGYFTDPVKFNNITDYSIDYYNKYRYFEKYLKINISQRYDLLAGIVDHYGVFINGILSLNLVSDAIKFLCFSLGFIVLESQDEEKIQIYGNLTNIPTKEINLKNSKINISMDVVKEYKGQYIGFQLDGKNRRFLLGNFIVTHNSTLTKSLSGIVTQRHSLEKINNKSIKLGYANLKIFKCQDCEKPKCYQSSKSNIFELKCQYCEKNMELVKHVSIIDCPGHNIYMATMLNGACVMNNIILVSAVNNKNLPAQQTIEHVKVSEFQRLDVGLICVNKIDLVSKRTALKQIKKLREYVNRISILKNCMIIPISANYNINTDVICEYIANIDEPKYDTNLPLKMMIIRSFNGNRQNVKIKDMKGGIIGGTIISGKISVGDRIKILPGLISYNNDRWFYRPLESRVRSIKSEQNIINTAIPGGLIGIQLSIDPGYTVRDRLIGNIIQNMEHKYEYKIYDKIEIMLKKFDKTLDLSINDNVTLNCHASNIQAKILDKDNNKLKLILKSPIYNDKNDTITLSQYQNLQMKIVGQCKILNGRECDLI